MPAKKAKKRAKVTIKASAFLAAYAATGHIGVAAKAAGIDRSMHYRRIRRQDPGYQAAFAEAHQLAGSLLVDEAVRRAIHGTRRAVYYKGRRVGHQLEYSDGILVRLLEARFPREFRKTHELTGPDGGPIQGKLEVVFVPAPAAISAGAADQTP